MDMESIQSKFEFRVDMTQKVESMKSNNYSSHHKSVAERKASIEHMRNLSKERP